MRILVIEDEEGIREYICSILKKEGYAIDAVITAEDGSYMLTQNDYDAVILDIILPDGSGLDILKEYRKTGKMVPVLILSALGGTADRVGGLDLGADDYLVKPFEAEELLARVRALVRRRYSQPDPIISVQDLSFNTRTREVKRGNVVLELKPKEYAVLEILIRYIGVPVTRTMLWEHLYDFDYDGISNTVDVYVSRLRAKVDLPEFVQLIHTVRGVGYVLSGDKK